VRGFVFFGEKDRIWNRKLDRINLWKDCANCKARKLMHRECKHCCVERNDLVRKCDKNFT